MRRAAVAIVALVVGMGSGACSGDDSGSGDQAAAADAGLHVTLKRSTLFETHRSLSLSVRSDGDRDIEVSDLQLVSPLFEAVDPEDRDARVRAGRVVEVPLPFGTADCEGEADGPAELEAAVDGEAVQVDIDESPSELLATLHRNECAEAAIRDQLELTLEDDWERTGPTTIEGRLDMAQREDGVTASIEQMTGNVLFTVSTDDGSGDGDGDDEGDGPWLTVDDDHPSTSGHVVIKISRCDPHALIEFKRPFVITGFVTVGDADPVRVDIEAQGDARQTMGDLMSGCLQ
ncbi:MAG TPA: hypothetical protein VGO78_20930 [Acidimicrobiales bacterium]|nr:hypothetical protein [Acidimicrobiales bacterium]